ncbi:MAG: helix-turn-helix domain-containing protein [Dehalococcoidia bacterium]|nr:helix-turn-helix domain-containing protein [Dehalococcoidia bacterium]
MDKVLLTLEETRQQYIPVGRNRIYELAAEGKLPIIRFGRKIFVNRIALEKMLAEAASSVQ